MVKQKDVFLSGEGDAWFERNRARLGLYDPVTELIQREGIRPKCVLEVGCANGWRLAKLRDLYDCEVFGVEPSMKAAMEAATLRVPVHQMTASTLPVRNGGFDMIIYGFCLYLTDPDDWLMIAAEGDRALATGGHIVIHDFGWVRKPYGRRYEHNDKITAYHVDFSQLWLSHPAYERIADGPTSAQDDCVRILRKQHRMEVLP